MDEALHILASYVALLAEAIAVLLIAIGSTEAIVGIGRVLISGHSTGLQRRAVWLDFARWLVAALTFQLAADIVGTSLSPSWEEVGHLAAIAAIRTFLSFFLDREVDSARDLQHTREAEALARAK